jgi:hypothetical protein
VSRGEANIVYCTPYESNHPPEAEHIIIEQVLN